MAVTSSWLVAGRAIPSVTGSNRRQKPIEIVNAP
jgi:hypothetical protein